MKKDFFKEFLDLNKLFVKTLVIKSEISAESLNEFIKLTYGNNSVSDDKTTWKYYMNLAGEYHPTDQVMKITSLDTLTEIDFTKENLELHPVTKDAYQYGTKYYNSLLYNYPDREQLILGIIYPCDKTTAINADDYTILYYNKDLIEPQESTLIYDLQDYIYTFQDRWDNGQFSNVHELYYPAQHAIMYLNIIPKLLNLRFRRCKTAEAHSFHIKEYLSSHQYLDRYIPYLNYDQILYFYKNILYIERHQGSTEQFLELVDKVLTERGIPLGSLTIKHLNEFDERYLPNVVVQKKALNLKYFVPEKTQYPLDDLFIKENPLAPGNEDYNLANQTKVTDQFKISNTSVLQTKYLESTLFDYEGSIPDPAETVFLRQWIFMSYNNLYNTNITFKDPKSSVNYTLNTFDSFIYFYYLTLKHNGFNITTIPDYYNHRVRKVNLPLKQTLLDLVNLNDQDYLEPYIDNFLNNSPTVEEVKSVKAFYNLTYSIYEQALNQWIVLSNINEMNQRGYLDQVINNLYEDHYVDFSSTPITISTWLSDHNLPIYNYTNEEAKLLINSIFTQVTGLNINPNKLIRNISKELISLMIKLSSYSVQYIHNVNPETIDIVGQASIRISYPDVEYTASTIDIALGHFLSTEFSFNHSFNLNNEINIHNNNIIIEDNENYLLNSVIGIHQDFNGITYPLYDPLISNNSEFVGVEYYNLLTDPQKQNLATIFN